MSNALNTPSPGMIPLLLSPQAPDGPTLEAFFTRHQDLIQQERSAEEEQTRLLNSNCSQKELESKGLSLGALGVSGISVGLGGKNLVELHRPLAYHISPALPPHTFRNGDPVRIEAHVLSTGKKVKKKVGEESEEGAVEGIIYRVSSEKVVVAVDGAKDVDLPERVRLLKLANSATFDRMEKTISHLQRIVVPSCEGPTPSLSASNLPLINSLLGIHQPSWLNAVPPSIEAIQTQTEGIDIAKEDVKWYGDKLNDSQKEAIEFCLKAEHIACIHGPPGTGKTHTLVELIFQLLSRPASASTSQPPRILVTTPSNLALDNLLLRLHALSRLEPYSSLLPPGSILRLGHPTRVHRDLLRETLDYRAANGDEGELVRDVGREIEGHLGTLGKKRGEKGAVKGKERGLKWGEVRELRKEYRQREAKVVKNVVNAARVVLATCHSAGSRQLNNLSFDVCIVDEATQAIEAVCWVPILKSRKLILAGDPQQLPPTIMSKGDTKVKEPKVKEPKASKTTNVTKEERPEMGPSRKDGPREAAGLFSERLEAVGIQEESTGKSHHADLESPADETEKKSANGSNSSDKPRLRPPRTLETTLFDRLERLYGPGIKRMLNVQYRMNEKIAAFPSSTLYDNNLISAPSIAHHTLLDLPTVTDTTSDEAKDVLESTVIFYDTAGCEFYEKAEGDGESSGSSSFTRGIGEGSKLNENEADVAVRWARKLVNMGVPPHEIGIVLPYQAQVSLISSLLHEEYPTMTIGTVDGLQGQERDAIILSLVRSNPKGEVGFLGEYRRLNVAMTRARRQLCVIGDSDTVAKGSQYLKGWMEWLESNADVRYAGDEV